ncbi:MAG: hypothetical protein R3C11_23785 [Planctomycetaceae bacterium]
MIDYSTIVDEQSQKVIGRFGLLKNNLVQRINTSRDFSNEAAFSSNDDLVLLKPETFGTTRLFNKFPIMDEAVHNSLNQIRTGSGGLLNRGSELSIKINIDSPDVTPTERSLETIKAALKSKIEEAGHVNADDAEFTLAFYYGESITKAVYQKNQSLIVRAPWENIAKGSLMRNSKPNVILALENSAGQMVWGQALELTPAALKLDMANVEEQAPALDFGSSSDSPAPKSTKSQTKIENSFTYKSLMKDMTAILVPIFIPEDPSGRTLPYTVIHNLE